MFFSYENAPVLNGAANHEASLVDGDALKCCRVCEDAPQSFCATFEPERLLSSISAILSAVIGIHYGHVLIHFKDHATRLKSWLSMGIGRVIIGIILHFTDAIPLNKQLYSFSYVYFTAGIGGIVFLVFYILIDVWGIRIPFLLIGVDGGEHHGYGR